MKNFENQIRIKKLIANPELKKVEMITIEGVADVVNYMESLGFEADEPDEQMVTNNWDVDYWQYFLKDNKKAYFLTGNVYMGTQMMYVVDEE